MAAGADESGAGVRPYCLSSGRELRAAGRYEEVATQVPPRGESSPLHQTMDLGIGVSFPNPVWRVSGDAVRRHGDESGQLSPCPIDTLSFGG